MEGGNAVGRCQPAGALWYRQCTRKLIFLQNLYWKQIFWQLINSVNQRIVIYLVDQVISCLSRGNCNLEWGLYTGDFERWMKEGSRNGASLFEGGPWGGPGGRTPLLGTPKDMLSKALEEGICFHRGPADGKRGGTLFSLVLWEMEKNSYLEESAWEFRERCK